MRTLIAAALVAAALPAFASDEMGGARTTAPDKGVMADMAKKHVDVSDIDLQASKLYVNGIFDLAQKASTWDKDHATALFNDAQRSVTEAEVHLGHLADMAVANNVANANTSLAKARTDLVNTESMMKALATPIKNGSGDPASIQRQSKDILSALDDAQKNLESGASDLKVDYKLKSP